MLALLMLQNALADDWRVVETEHYRVHYRLPAEGFALHAAQQLESVRDRVARAFGTLPEYTTQVVVDDPYGMANGMAIPLGQSPRVMLWAVPPTADSTIGHYDDWAVDLTLHEDVHVVHLMLPPRGASGKLVSALFGLNPIALKSPAWVLEGYATVLEGSLTGSGRPYSDYRATWLRELARSGTLPTYGQLDGRDGFEGGSLRYQVGSAYLEWLVARTGDEALPALWKRMTARRTRSFEEAFEGVFGDTPRALYGRFTAELTADAMASESDAPSTRWDPERGDLGVPTVSPDGGHLAMTRTKDGVTSLLIKSTRPDPDAQKDWDQAVADLLERDPDDVAGVPPPVDSHEVVHHWTDRTHDPSSPVWLDDDTVLYVGHVLDDEGRLRRDVFRWDFDEGSPRRLTHGADVHRLGSAAGRVVGVMSHWGETGLVEINARTGVVTPLLEPSALRVVDQIQVSPDGRDLAWLQNDGQGWQLRSGIPGTAAVVPAPGRVRQFAWGPDGIVASVGVDGYLDLYRLGGETPVRLTDSGAAFAPAPGADSLYFLQLGAKGYELHRIDSQAPVLPAREVDADLAARPVPEAVEALPVAAVEGRRMGLGRMESRLLVGGAAGRGGSNLEVGMRIGDIVGRNEFVVLAGVGDGDGVSGLGGFWANRTLAVDTLVHAWVLRDGLQPTAPGVELALSGDGGGSVVRGSTSVGVWGETREGGIGGVFVESDVAWLEPLSRALRVSGGVRAQVGADAGVVGSQVLVDAALRWGRLFGIGLEGTFGLDRVGFQLGGVPSGLRGNAAQWQDLQVGWLPSGVDSARRMDRVHAEIGSPQLALMVERYRLHDAGSRAYSLAGLVLDQQVGRQPLVRMPAVSIQLGVGCAFEADGVVDKACRELSHWRAWSAVSWRP